MSGELCTERGCGSCGRCDAADTESTPTATEAIDADLEALTEKLCADAAKLGLGETAIGIIVLVTRKAYMEGWYRGHETAGALALRIDRELRADREAKRGRGTSG